MPLDDERCWYRYHHLFAEVLRERLERQAPERIREIHLCASAWYAEEGEIDHTYVNPTTDNYLEDLQMAMPDYTHWNDETQGYRSAYATFNEYMTWNVFSLYVMDTHPEHEWEHIIRKQEAFMQTNRDLPKFRPFNRELMRLYREKDADETVAELYPEILTWVAEQNGS